MKSLVALLLVTSLIFSAGCGSSDKNNPGPAQETQNPAKAEEKPLPKAEEKPLNKAEEKPVTNSPQEELKSQAMEGLILVFSVNERVEAKEKENILEALKKKWFEGKKYTLVTPQEFQAKIKGCVGKTVITAEARSDYGEYEFTIRTGKIVAEDGEAVEEPAKPEDGPDAHIRGCDSVDNLIKEIRFVK